MSAVREYVEELGRRLEPRFTAAEVERILEEVEAHLRAELEASGRSVERVLADFGSPDEVARAYRRSGIDALAGDVDIEGVSDAGSRGSHRARVPRDFPGPRSARDSRDARGPHGRPSLRGHRPTSLDHSPRPGLMDLLDIGTTLRNLLRRPAFALVIVATLSVGIGATAVILSVVNGVLLQPLPFPEPDRLVRVHHSAPGLDLDREDIGLSDATYLFFRETDVLEDLAIYQEGAANVSGDEQSRRVATVRTSHSFFETLGVPPVVGRTFNPDDELPGASPVVVLAEGFWRESFGGRRDVVGESVLVDGQRVEIVGVVPADLTFPSPDAAMYRPVSLDPERTNIGALGLDAVGRLAEGITPSAAAARLAARVENLTDSFPDDPAARILDQAGLTAHVTDLREHVVGDYGQRLWVLLGSVGFILLIACANVANVFLVRADGREREMAIRSALGAGRGRLAAAFLAESAVLGLASGAVGLLLAFAGVRALVRWGPRQVPRIGEVGVDATVMAATLAVALLAGLLFGLVPALRYRPGWLGAVLREGGRSSTAGRARFRLRAVLVGVQVALALVLLVGSGLMVRSYRSLSAVDPGFDPDSVLTFQVALNPNDYPGEEVPASFIQRALDTIGGMQGVVAVGAASDLPLSGTGSGRGWAIEDRPLGPDELPPVHFFDYVSPGYFETLRIPLVAGRTFERADHEERRPSVIVNETFARLFWPDEDPIGRRIQPGGGAEPSPALWYTIVGVVADVRSIRLEDEPGGRVYLPLQSVLREDAEGNRISPGWRVGTPQFAVRTADNPTALVEPVRRRIAEMDPNLPIARVQTLEQSVDDAMATPSFTMMLLLAGSVGALLIGAVGIYGVISYVVSQQTREIGVRMALGARARDIGRMVLGRSLLVTGVGIVVGVFGARFLTRFMDSMLYGVEPLDVATFVAGIVTLTGVASAAAWVPARRAAGVDPLEALRRE